MITDALCNFVPVGSPLAILGANVRSAVYDILGSGTGTAPANIFGTATLFGEDTGIGGKKPQLEVLVTQAFVGGTSLQVSFQAAPDLGTPTYQPGTWTTLVQTPAILTASLTLGQVLARFDWPPAFPAGLNPRFLSLLFVPVGTFTAGLVLAPVTMVRDDQANKFAAKNFTVA